MSLQKSGHGVTERLKSASISLLEISQFLQHLEQEWANLELEKNKLKEEKKAIQEEKQKIQDAWHQINLAKSDLNEKRQQSAQALPPNEPYEDQPEQTEYSFFDELRTLFSELFNILRLITNEINENKVNKKPLDRNSALNYLKGIKEVSSEMTRLINGKTNNIGTYYQSNFSPAIAALFGAIRTAIDGNYNDLENQLNELKNHSRAMIEMMKTNGPSESPNVNQKLSILLGLGYTKEVAVKALQYCKGDLEASKAYLKNPQRASSVHVSTSPRQTNQGSVKKQVRGVNFTPEKEETPNIPNPDPPKGKQTETNQEDKAEINRSHSNPSVTQIKSQQKPPPNTAPNAASSMPSSQTLGQLPSVSPAKPTTSWNCYKCLQINKPENLKCQMCGYVWLSPEQINEAEELKRRNKEIHTQNSGAEHWLCEHCQGKNAPSEHCIYCGKKRTDPLPSPPQEQEDDKKKMRKGRSTSLLNSKGKKKIVSSKDAKVQLQYTKNYY